jgi:signal transduction histidine kinase/ActR/RegA family two-component response regulator
MLGYSGLLIYYAVWSPSIAAQAPIATHLQDATVMRIEDNIVNFLNYSRSQASIASEALSHELRRSDDSWESMEKLQGILWGAVAQNPCMGNAIFQSTSNLSTSYYRNGIMSEYSRVEANSTDIQVYAVDDFGHRTSTPPTILNVAPLYDRTWYILALAKNDSVAVSSTVGILGTRLVTFSTIVRDGRRVRGVVSMGFAVPQIQARLSQVDPIATIYLLTTHSLRLISANSNSSIVFQDATASNDSVIANSAKALRTPLLDANDHRGTIKIQNRRYFYAIRKVSKNFNATIVSLLPRDVFFKQVDQSRQITIGIFVTALALWLLFAMTVGTALVKTRWREHAHLARAESEARLRLEKQSATARLSHELRTPMAAVLGLLEVLDGECVSVEQKANVSLIQKTSADMMQLLDGLLMLAKADSGKSNVEEQIFNMRKELEAAVATISPLTTPRGVKVSLWYDPDLQEELLGDRRKIRQVIDNLLSNSAKFTDKGHVMVRASKGRFVPPFTQFVDVHVEDTGCGIPESRLEDIFKEFVQADHNVRSKYGGSGLGLSIVRSLCKLMGGDVEIENSTDAGTCFHFWLKLKSSTTFRKAETVIKNLDAPSPLRGLHILVAEDTRLLSKLIERMLKKEGAAVTLSADGVEVVEAYRATPEAFSAILMDLQMPRMDGYEATKTIRDFERTNYKLGRVPIIAVTAHAMDSDAEKCRAVGMDDYIRKPVDKQIVVSTLLHRARGRTLHSPMHSPRTPTY